MNFGQTKQRSGGFSLMELMLAMALGLVLLGAATQLFKSSITTTSLISNRTEMQQNLRSALDLVAKDVSMAGAGLPAAGLQLPTGAGSVLSKIACNQGGQCYLNNAGYANGTVGTAPALAVANYMYPILPGAQNGVEKVGATSTSTSVPAINTATTGIVPDSITVVYVDFAPQFNQFDGMFVDATGGQVVLSPPTPFPATLAPATAPGTGLQVGDLLYVTNGVQSAIGEVTAVAPYLTNGATVTLANADALNINQSGAFSNNMKSVVVPLSFPPRFLPGLLPQDPPA
jgi:prepilin-type N-terminal cleavage/methylation domain-containing protein